MFRIQLLLMLLLACGCSGTGPAATPPAPAQATTASALPVAILTRSQLAAGNQARLQRLFQKGRSGLPVTLAAIGGSITRGAMSTDEPHRYPNLVQSWWNRTFPASAGSLVNAGVDATCSDYGSLRVQRDVLAQNPDLVIVEFAVNDLSGGLEGLGDAYEGLLRQLLDAPGHPAVVLLFMMTYNPCYSAQDWQSVLGAHYDLPMVSFFDAINPELQAGRMTWPDLSPDGTHPNDRGHDYTAQFLVKALEAARAAFPAGSALAAIPPTPAVMRSGDFEATDLLEGSALSPTANQGWQARPASGTEGAGLEASTQASRLQFTLTGRRLFLSYWKVQGPMGQVLASVDGGAPLLLDGWAEGNPGGCRAMACLGSGLAVGTHTLSLTLVGSAHGSTFRVLCVGSAGLESEAVRKVK